MNSAAPASINEYLQALRLALQAADPALVQDALYDAEQHLRAEIAANPNLAESEVLAKIVKSYGAPEEVAAAYLETESRVQAAMATPMSRRHSTHATSRGPATAGIWQRFFGVYGDVRTYTMLFYCLLALFTGVFYFTFVAVGLSLSIGLAILIIGAPFFVLFIGAARLLALVEGRLVEAMTGERMPRRPATRPRDLSLLQRIGQMLKEIRTWTTLAYQALMLPLGIAYFVIVVVGLSLGAGLIAAAIFEALAAAGFVLPGQPGIHLASESAWMYEWIRHPIGLLLIALGGILVTTVTLHVVRGLGRLHGAFAKRMLVTL
jgi:uncharacterized membrane protein